MRTEAVFETVILWDNGRVMVFNESGELPEYQGRFCDVWPRVYRESLGSTQFLIGSWRHGTIPANREALQAFYETILERTQASA